MTTVQDWPGRTGLWQVGVPPSGPMDDRSFRLGNRVLGNAEGTPGLECTLQRSGIDLHGAGHDLRHGRRGGGRSNGAPVARCTPVDVAPGATLDVGTADGHGLRVYVLVAGGLDVPAFLGSAATFTLGQFGGHGGRALRPGDVLIPGQHPPPQAPDHSPTPSAPPSPTPGGSA